jgi:hypothetical protein
MGSLRSSLKCFMKVMRCQPGIPCCGGSGLSHPRAMYSSPRSSPCPTNCMSPAVLPVLRPWVLMPSLTAELLCECSRSSKMRGHVSFLPSLRSPSWANSSSRDYMLLVRAIFLLPGYQRGLAPTYLDLALVHVLVDVHLVAGSLLTEPPDFGVLEEGVCAPPVLA